MPDEGFPADQTLSASRGRGAAGERVGTATGSASLTNL